MDWTKLWGEMYPILTTYPQQVELSRYTGPLEALLRDLETTYQYTPLDAFLVLKDILGKLWTEAAKVQLKGAGEGMAQKSREILAVLKKRKKKQGRE